MSIDNRVSRLKRQNNTVNENYTHNEEYKILDNIQIQSDMKESLVYLFFFLSMQQIEFLIELISRLMILRNFINDFC